MSFSLFYVFNDLMYLNILNVYIRIISIIINIKNGLNDMSRINVSKEHTNK